MLQTWSLEVPLFLYFNLLNRIICFKEKLFSQVLIVFYFWNYFIYLYLLFCLLFSYRTQRCFGKLKLFLALGKLLQLNLLVWKDSYCFCKFFMDSVCLVQGLEFTFLLLPFLTERKFFHFLWLLLLVIKWIQVLYILVQGLIVLLDFLYRNHDTLIMPLLFLSDKLR